MAHVDELVLAGDDQDRDTATELFLQEHLRDCPACRELRRKVVAADRLLSSRETRLLVPPRAAPSSPIRRGSIPAVGTAVALLVFALVAGGGIRQWRISDVAGTAAAPAETVSFTIDAVAPWHTSGTGRATLTNAGDLVLEVSVRGPEVTRSSPQPGWLNLIWHLVEGTCAQWEADEKGHNVIDRWTIEPKAPDVQEFRYVVPKAVLDALTRPHAVAAFRNGGGGPLYACGDVPPLRVASPSSSGDRSAGADSALARFFDTPAAYPGYKWTRNGQLVTEFEFETIAGPDHCGWQTATMLFIGWPPGTVSKNAAEARQYVRDPRGVIQHRPELRQQWGPHATLPSDARSTGYRYGPLEVYVGPGDQDQFIYIVGPDGAERWPRSEPMTLCA